MAEQRIDLNAATAEELAQLPGIGPVLAQRIVSYREAVHPYGNPADLTAVSGIGERSYRAIADRLMVMPSEDGSVVSADESSDQELEDGALSRASQVEREPRNEFESFSEEEAAPQEAGAEIEATPPGESLSEEDLTLEKEVWEERAEETSPGGEEAAEEAPPEAEQEPVAEEAATQAEEEPVSVSLPTPAEAPAARPWWRRLSWLWAALLGGVLGLVFAMIVFAGINGSLDVGHSRAVLGIESDLNGLTADVKTLGTDVEGLRRRLETLEGLTGRMDDVELTVDNLSQETSDLRELADALNREVDALSAEMRLVSDNVAVLQDQAERTTSFFSGLQALMSDVFGGTEGMPAPTPAPEEK